MLPNVRRVSRSCRAQGHSGSPQPNQAMCRQSRSADLHPPGGRVVFVGHNPCISLPCVNHQKGRSQLGMTGELGAEREREEGAGAPGGGGVAEGGQRLFGEERRGFGGLERVLLELSLKQLLEKPGPLGGRRGRGGGGKGNREGEAEAEGRSRGTVQGWLCGSY